MDLRDQLQQTLDVEQRERGPQRPTHIARMTVRRPDSCSLSADDAACAPLPMGGSARTMTSMLPSMVSVNQGVSDIPPVTLDTANESSIEQETHEPHFVGS